MKKRYYMIISFVLLIVTIGFLYTSTSATTNEPGTVQDPLVTKSYVDEVVDKLLAEIQSSSNTVSSDVYVEEELYDYIDEKILEVLGDGSEDITIEGAEKFEVIAVEAGQQLICEESTEVILRGGKAYAIGNSEGNGISDITAGVDLKTGESIPYNHLIIIPRTDGRGLGIETKSWIMIKGKYTIESIDK